MTLKQLQEEQRPWVAYNFGKNRPSWQPLLGLVEEVGELSHTHLKTSQRIRTDENHLLNAIDAVGDIVIYLADYCSAVGIDLERAVEETWNKVKSRDWKKYPQNGLTK